MRLICTLDDPNQCYMLSAFLAKEGIENQLEFSTNTDWGSPAYGTAKGKVWVYDEDRFEEALKLANEFLQDPRTHVLSLHPSLLSGRLNRLNLCCARHNRWVPLRFIYLSPALSYFLSPL